MMLDLTKQGITSKDLIVIRKEGSKIVKVAKTMTGHIVGRKNTKFTNGNGCMITIEAGQADTRERPYTIENVKGEGKRKPTKAFQIVDNDTKVILATVFGTKDDADKAIKTLYTEKDYKGNCTCEIIYKITEGEPIASKGFYTPSKNAKLGTYIAFGVEA